MTPIPHTYRVQFRSGETNHCPGCGKAHWIIGRFSAECASCGTAIEIAGMPARMRFVGRRVA